MTAAASSTTDDQRKQENHRRHKVLGIDIGERHVADISSALAGEGGSKAIVRNLRSAVVWTYSPAACSYACKRHNDIFIHHITSPSYIEC